MPSLDKASQIRELKNYEAWRKQIWFWRTHLDRFIEDYFKIKLKPSQRVDARILGNFQSIDLVKNRGAGKTWVIAICAIAIGVLYPGSSIAVISSTAEQAVLVIKKIEDKFIGYPDVLREINASRHNKPVQINPHKGVCWLKSGSKIESYSMGTLRGNRAKILICDEAPEIPKNDLDAVAKPIMNETRDICIQRGIEDYDSKIISITSACLKNNYFYTSFVNILKRMSAGEDGCFAWAMTYKEAVREGISKQSYFDDQRKDMTEEKFMMEYESKFLGAAEGAVFPFELTDKCRTLKDVEIAQPAKSTVEYLMSLDIATSSASNADNAALTTFKLVELENGGYLKQVVRIQTFKGKRLDSLATEVRKNLVLFPNTIKVVVDVRGLGDAFPQFMCKPWTDPGTGKEYPPLVRDDEPSIIDNAVPLIHPFIATNLINQQMVNMTTVALEQESIQFPVNSRYIVNNKIAESDDDAEGAGRKLTVAEKAIFVEADALQIEMGNIIGRQGANGNVLFETAKSTMHKDRVSSLMMGIHYIAGLEETRKRNLIRGNAGMVYGIVSSIY
jgi:ribonucleoside-diphosphate reductase alpha chain